MEKTTTIFHVDGRQREMEVNEAARLIGYGQAGAGRGWSFLRPPPVGWEREVPRYKATRDLQPSPNSRHRLEPPFEKIWDDSVYQYGERPIMRGEIVLTRKWPHESFMPLNFGAERVLSYFNSHMKSRLPGSPFRGDQIVLDDGLTGPAIVQPVAPQLQPMDLRPAS